MTTFARSAFIPTTPLSPRPPGKAAGMDPGERWASHGTVRHAAHRSDGPEDNGAILLPEFRNRMAGGTPDSDSGTQPSLRRLCKRLVACRRAEPASTLHHRDFPRFPR